MRLVELRCEHFRCLERVRFTPGPGINVVRGENAQGKTSLLEAILYAATSRSHRTTAEGELVRRGEPGFRVALRANRQDRDVTLETSWWKGTKRIKINGVAQARVSDLLGKINVVFFSPEDAELVRGPAARRRAFLDMELSQLSPAYLYALQQYRQAVRQRNELLRRGAAEEAELEAWDAQLVTHGAVLIDQRRGFVRELSAGIAETYRAIAGAEECRVTYEPDVADGAGLCEALVAARATDRRQGLTTRGPHRDDVIIEVEGKKARAFASQGQQKTVALALRLAEVELVRVRAGEYPVLLLDDVLSELDRNRSTRLTAVIPVEAQCVLTTTDLTDGEVFGREAVSHRIHGGRLET